MRAPREARQQGVEQIADILGRYAGAAPVFAESMAARV
jgi:hypothetical protein